MYQFIEEMELELNRVSFLLEKAELRIKGLKNGKLKKRCFISRDVYYEVNSERVEISGPMYEEDYRVREIKQYRLLKEQIKRLRRNKETLETAIKRYRRYSIEDINAEIPVTYSGATIGDDYETKKQQKDHDSPRRRRMNYTTEHITADGTKVRSMAEIAIYNLLLQYKIPFDYESLITLDDGTVRVPDFIIRKRNGRKLLWEHIGMFGKEEYKKEFFRKMEDYYESNIVAGSNLILTFSKKDNSVDTKAIDEIIRRLIKPVV